MSCTDLQDDVIFHIIWTMSMPGRGTQARACQRLGTPYEAWPARDYQTISLASYYLRH